ncbi:HAD-like domain-containing protein [Xylariales sp. PMI_506]|nr:HAD-like domain-containing protein [Xylariales sp. PMI_506]
MSIFLDFDGTITAQDTIGELAKFALRVREAEGDDLKQEWDAVVKAYVRDYGQYVDEYHTCESDRRLPEHEVQFLREMKNVELKSLERINGCQVFRGIPADRFRQAGRDAVRDGVVRIRPGFREFVDARAARGWRIWVISVNWSAAFIEGVLDCPTITVIANQVREDGSVVGPETIDIGSTAEEPRNLTNSCDKIDAMRAILESEALHSKPSFYFGDSITDLECLLAATHGVIMSDKEDSKLLDTLGRIGKEVPHATRLEPHQSLCWASNYHEINENVQFD